MAYVRVASLAVFFLATSLMAAVKKIEAGACARSSCSLSSDCGYGCMCRLRPPIPYPFPRDMGVCIGGVASDENLIQEHRSLCQSHDECKKKGSGNFCARYSHRYTDYGWCFDSASQAMKAFFKMPTTIAQ